MKRVIILGAGISGLAAAWNLRGRCQLLLLEKSGRAGGHLRSAVDGPYLFELGPRSCRTKGRGSATLSLAEELGLADQLITPPPKALKRYLLMEGKLRELSLRTLLSPLSAAVVRDLTARHAPEEDETIEAFSLRHFGCRATRQLVDPMVTGIYGGDLSKLSMRSCFPDLFRIKREGGTFLRAALRPSPKKTCSPFVKKMQRFPLFSFKGGMQTLTDTLASKLEGVIRYQCGAARIQIDDEKVAVVNEQGQLFVADQLISTLPAQALAPLLQLHHPSIARQLAQVDQCSLATLSLGYRSHLLKKEGFGYLIPSSEKEDCLGVVWDSSLFPQNNGGAPLTRLSVMLGGVRRPDLLKESDDTLLAYGLDAVKRHMGIEAPPDRWRIERIAQAIPQYEVGHHQRIEALLAEAAATLPRLTLLGTAFHGVSINDCVWHSRSQAVV